MVDVSPFPGLPVFVAVPSTPHPGEQALPPLVKVQVAPAKLPLLWLMTAVNTKAGVPAGIDDGLVCRAKVVVFFPILHPRPPAHSRTNREQTRVRWTPFSISAEKRESLRIALLFVRTVTRM